MSKKALSDIFRRWVARGGRLSPASVRNRSRLRLEEVERREVPATLPAPTLTSTAIITGLQRIPPTPGNPKATDFGSPMIVANPTNPLQEVAVAIGTQYDTSAGNAVLSSWLVGEYTNDGGISWIQFYNTQSSFSRLTDPTIDPQNKTRDQIAYNITYSPTLAFARDGNVYVSSVESNPAKTSGALVVNRFDFSRGAPTTVNLDPNGVNDAFISDNVNVVYRWAGTDPALNPYIAVDNSVGSFTDPETKQTTVGDTMLNNPQLALAGDPNAATAGKAVYVVWNTNVASRTLIGHGPYNSPTNPNAILLASSPDRGQTFSAPVLVNDRGYVTSAASAPFDSYASPQVIFSPPRSSATSPATGANPAEMTIQWTGTQRQQLITDVSAPDADATGRPSANEPAVVTHEFSSGRFSSPQAGVNVITESPKDDTNGDPGALSTSTTASALGIPIDFSTDPNFFFDPGTRQNGRPLTDLNVTIALTHPNMAQVRIVLIAPDGTRITLVENRLNGKGETRAVNGVNFGLAANPNLGIPTYGFGTGRQTTVPINGPAVGTVFDSEAPRQIHDPNNLQTAATGYLGHFQPEGGSLSQLYGMTPAQLSGTWKLEILDARNDRIDPANNDIPPQFLNFWSLKFVAKQDNGQGGSHFGGDRLMTNLVMTGGVDDTNAYKPTASPAVGIGPGVSLAYDATLGSYAPFSGRLYAAYTVPIKDGAGNIIDTDIQLSHSDDNGKTWSPSVRVNDDSAFDNFTEGRRTQFLPAVTVDQVSGTVVVTWFDARTDAANARVSTFVATSLDGGATFSPQVTLNNNRTVVDAITNKTIVAEPIPTNVPQFQIPNLVGGRASVIANGGRINGFWAGNDNAVGSNVFIGTAVTATGPRILSGDMGPIVAGQNTGGTAGIAYNNTFAADGTRQLTGFTVTFDRAIDVNSFTAATVQVLFRSPTTQVGTGTNGIPIPLDSTNPVTPVDPVTPVAGFGASATKFFVKFATPQSAVGTYSYSVGPNIRDRIRHVTPARGSPTSFTSTDTPLRVPLPPGSTIGTTVSSLTVPVLPGNPRIGTATVHVNLTHTYDSDLRFTLIAPNGTTTVLLSNRRGGPGHDYLNTTFTDAAAIPISAGSPPFTGAFQPETPLSALAGLPVGGTWQLQIDDLALQDYGTLLDWSLSFTDQTGAQVTNPGYQPPVAVTGNRMDQNANGVDGEPQDAFSAPRATNGLPFSQPYDPTTLPLIIPGPYVIGTAVPGQPAGTTDNLVLNAGSGALDVTFDRDIDPATFTTANILRMTGPAGPITGPFTITPNPAGTPAGLAKRVFRISFPPQVVDGTYTIELGPDTQNNYISSVNVPRLIVDQLPAGSTTQTVTFDHNIPAGGFTPADVTMTGPTGPVTPVAVAPVAGNPRQFTLTFAPQPAGTYRFDFRPDLTVAGTASKVDTNLNAGLDVLRGASPANGTTVTTAYTTGIQNVTIPANGKTGLSIDIQDDFVIQQLIDSASVPNSRMIQVLLDITFPNDPDLTAVLVGPHGERVTLFSGLTGQGQPNQNDFSGTQLNDHPQSAPITNARPPYNPGAGAFNPQFPLGTKLNGVSSKGTWLLEITNNGSQTGVLKDFSLTLPHVLPGTGLGEPVADRVSLGFRIFTQNPSIPLTKQVWTPIGPASENGNGNSSRTTGLAVDPSDPSGNTVFVGGASGGIWKTTNFLTTDPQGPRWIPLTDNGPTFAINIGSIAVFGRNNDTSKSIVIAATGEGDVGKPGLPNPSPGVGFLLSSDGGKTWSVLDSTSNADATGAIYPIQSPKRDHLFVGASAFKVIVDPTPNPGGKLILYAALSHGKPAANGVWRSNDGGLSWTRIQSGDATDVVLAAGSAGANGNLQVLYAAVRGQGVFYTAGAPGTVSMVLTNGLAQNPQFRDADVAGNPRIPIGTTATPNGPKGRISLATPAFVVGDPVRNLNYEGWLYALVSTSSNRFDGLYMTKDFGANWTKVYLPEYRIPQTYTGFGTNDTTAPEHDLFGGSSVGPAFGQGNYDQAIAIDPQNPNVVYMGGTNDGTRQPLGGFVRVDTTLLEDTQNLSAYSNQRPDGGQIQFVQGSGAVQIKPPSNFLGPGKLYGPIINPTVNTGYINLYRDPNNPFAANSDQFFTNIAAVRNTGFGARYAHFTAQIDTDVHRIITIIDPLTRKTRLIVGDDQGVASSVDNGDGTLNTGIGFTPTPNGGGLAPRNGNLQTAQFYYGAVQPSQLAADIAGSMFYGTAQDNGFPASTSDVIRTGQIGWNGLTGDGTGVATDQTGSGTTYTFKWPCCNNTTPQRFFEVNDPRAGASGRTNGLLQNLSQYGGTIDDPANNVGQWPFIGGANFAVNPVDKNGIIISAPGNNAGIGRVFRTTDQALNWFPIGEPNGFNGATFAPLGQYGPTLDGTYAPALAFGAPNQDASTTGLLDDFVYAGTSGGRIFVSRTGGAPWKNISMGLDGSGVASIVTDPRRGSTDAFAVTALGVYYKADAFSADPWKNITGNLFSFTQPVFGNATDPAPTLQYLTSIAADWRYAIPTNPGDPASPTFPVLYVGGEGGVFRSLDFGITWTYFPAASTFVDPATNITYNLPDGGYLPNAHVTDLDLSLGNIDPNTGLPKQSSGLNMLVATTYGRGSFGIRLGDAVPQYNIQFQPGPRVARILNPNPVGGPSTELDVVWSGPVDPQTFTPATVQLVGPGGVISNVQVTERPHLNPQGADLRDTYAITFPSQSAVGSYTLTIGYNPTGGAYPPNTPTIADPAGNLMNQNGNSINGEPIVDQYRTTITLNSTTNNHLVVTSSPGTAKAGTPAPVTIEAHDANDLPLTGVNGPLTLTAAPGTGPFTPTTATLVNGVATFSVTYQMAGSETVNASFAGPPTVNGTSWTTIVSAGDTARFVFDKPSYVVTAPATQTFTLTAKDRFGNTTNYSGPVTITSSGAAATLPPDPVTMTNGVATFSGQFNTSGQVQVTATGPDQTNPSNPPITGSATVSVSAGPATQIVVTPAAGPYAVNTPIQVTIQALDANGSPANNLDGQPLTITVQPGGTSTVSPAAPVFTNGVANITVTFSQGGTFTVTATRGTLSGTSGPITVSGIVPNPVTTVLPGIFAVGTGSAGSPVLQVFNPDGSPKFNTVPFPAGYHGLVDPASSGFTGGLRVAVGDVTGDGVPDYVVGTGPGIVASVVVIDGATGKTVFDYQPFGSFTGGVFVTVGDIRKKGFDDIVITPDEGGGPRVEILSGMNFALTANFFGIDDPNFRGGARAALGDVNGDGFADLVISAGFGGGPRISYYDGAQLAKGILYHPIPDFFAFEPALRNGAYVSIGDVNGDGYGDLIFGAGPGGGPRVLVVSGQTLLSTSVTAALSAPIANFFAGDLNNRGGIRVTAKNLNGDRFADVVTGSGEGGGSTVTGYSGLKLVNGSFLDPLFSFDAQPGYLGGVYVG